MSRISIRADFPILDSQINGHPLCYLDNAATTQKPAIVIDAMSDYYRRDNANVHRAAHTLAERATNAMETARLSVARFINAASSDEIIFTRGTTESINLVAAGFSRFIKPGDEVLTTVMEHHSNFVPWMMAAKQAGARLVTVPVSPTGEIDRDDFRSRLSDRTRLVAFAHVSNALGTVNPVADLIIEVRSRSDACILIDGAQAILHLPVDVQALDVDFYAFSAHKMYGPTGMGVLYGKRHRLEVLAPWQFGGEMIERVTVDDVTFNRLPFRFEAGTPNIAGAVGLGAAIHYLEQIPRTQLLEQEASLVEEAVTELARMPGVRLIGQPAHRLGVVSFVVSSGHAHDVGTLLDQQGVAVRTGHHCTMPLMDQLGVNGTVRASFSLYNERIDLERFLLAMRKVLTFL